ncbi:MAG: hypothetical protein ABIR81_12480 [Ginsengibacter sp.]
MAKDVAAQHGNCPALGKWLKAQIKNARLVELANIGHIPHVQALAEFKMALLAFIKD